MPGALAGEEAALNTARLGAEEWDRAVGVKAAAVIRASGTAETATAERVIRPGRRRRHFGGRLLGASESDEEEVLQVVDTECGTLSSARRSDPQVVPHKANGEEEEMRTSAGLRRKGKGRRLASGSLSAVSWTVTRGPCSFLGRRG